MTNQNLMWSFPMFQREREEELALLFISSIRLIADPSKWLMQRSLPSDLKGYFEKSRFIEIQKTSLGNRITLKNSITPPCDIPNIKDLLLAYISVFQEELQLDINFSYLKEYIAENIASENLVIDGDNKTLQNMKKYGWVVFCKEKKKEEEKTSLHRRELIILRNRIKSHGDNSEYSLKILSSRQDLLYGILYELRAFANDGRSGIIEFEPEKQKITLLIAWSCMHKDRRCQDVRKNFMNWLSSYVEEFIIDESYPPIKEIEDIYGDCENRRDMRLNIYPIIEYLAYDYFDAEKIEAKHIVKYIEKIKRLTNLEIERVALQTEMDKRKSKKSGLLPADTLLQNMKETIKKSDKPKAPFY